MMKNTSSVGAVIPAFNEADNLSRVLESVCATPWFAQIIVVDDGSSDDTMAIAQRYASRDDRLIALHLPQNQGKAGAMLAGVRALHADFVLFLDADLIGVHPGHLKALCQPVADRSYEMSIAVFRHGGVLTDASHLLAPNLTGQRCLRRLDAERILTPLKNSCYGVETGLTIYAKRQNWQIRKVVWRGVTHRMKEQKRKGVGGIVSRWQMYRQIATVWADFGRETFVQWRLAPKRKRIS